MVIERPDSAARLGDSGLTGGWPRLARLGRRFSVLALLAVAGFVVHEVLTGGGTLTSAIGWLARARLPWIAAAIACEAFSYLLYASAQRRLLGTNPRRLSTGWLASLAVCAQAVTNFLPAGYLAGNLLNFRELCRRRLAVADAAGLLVKSSALYMGALACLTLVGGELAGDRAGGSFADVRLGAAALLGALLSAAVGIWLLAKFDVLRLPARWRGRLRGLRVSIPVASAAGALFAASWLADAGCLVAAMRAVGAAPAWALVPIAYCAAQLVSFLPITPGGLGLVEGSLTIALVAAGGSSGRVLAAVLLYRVISYWGTLPCGLLGYLFVRRHREPGSTSVDADADAERLPAFADRAAGGDRPLLVLEG